MMNVMRNVIKISFSRLDLYATT